MSTIEEYTRQGDDGEELSSLQIQTHANDLTLHLSNGWKDIGMEWIGR